VIYPELLAEREGFVARVLREHEARGVRYVRTDP
jgi:hypothetical protein